VRGRISSALSDDDAQRLERVLNFEDLSINLETRRATLRDAVRHTISILEGWSTAVGLREEHRKGALKRFLITRDLTAMLDLKAET